MDETKNNEIWRKIVTIHQYSKVLIIFCEENDIQHRTFLQPLNELKNAYEHVIRAKACELGMSLKSLDTVPVDLDRALGHEYRCFFDICDWLSVQLRERVLKGVDSFTKEMICEVAPEYYTDIVPTVDRINREIAQLRADKDIAKGGGLMATVEGYYKVLTHLAETVGQLDTKIPALVRLSHEQINKFAGANVVENGSNQ